MNSELLDVLSHWPLAPITSIDRATSGVMNENFIVTTHEGPVVLRRHRRTQRDLVELEHRVIAHARANGVPAPAAIETSAGEVIIDRDGVFYSLFAFARVRQLTKEQITGESARSMGVTLAVIHQALVDCPGPAPRGAGAASTSTDHVVATVRALLRRIDQETDPTEQDGWARDHLTSKLRWLETATPVERLEPPQTAVQMIHGDYQETNLFFEDDHVVDVIDWDKAEVRWPVDEILRTMDLSLRLDPSWCAALLDGYRSRQELTADDLDLAANNYGYSQVHDHWLFEGIYVRNDERLRIFLEPGPFIPFSDRWGRLRRTVK